MPERLRRFWLTWLWGGAILFAALPAAAQGSHFIVLLDDSKYMRTERRSQLADSLPPFLFGGNEGKMQPFDPRHDTLSLLFFTVHRDGDGGGCKTNAEYSLLPDFIFQAEQLEPGNTVTEEAFSDKLHELMKRPCRGRGNLSPILSAPYLVLPFVDRLMPQDLVFARTIIVLGHYIRGAPTGIPTRELERFRGLDSDAEKGYVSHIHDAVELVQRQSSFYNLELAPGSTWRKGEAFLDAFEVLPRATPGLQVTAPSEILLDRVAVSPQRLLVEPQSAPQADLSILSSSAEGGAARLIPRRLSWYFVAAAGGPWKVGAKAFPIDEEQMDLLTCPQPCQKVGDHLLVPLLDLHPKPALSAEDKVPQGDGQLALRVGFLYRVDGSYSHLEVKTAPRAVALHLAPAQHVPGFLWGSDIVLDNRELTHLWTPTDAHGLTQAAARDRIVKQRNLIYLGIGLVAILTVLAVAGAFILHFYRTAFHRPFRPRLEWSPAGKIVLDFDHSASGRLLLGTLHIVNPESVPWFGARLGHSEQPTRRANLRLSAEGFQSIGIALDPAAGPPLGFLAGDAGNQQLSTETVESVSDGKRIHLFLAAESVRDLEEFPAGPELDDFTRELRLPVRIEWSGRAGRPPEAPFAMTEVSLSLRIKPEESREPQVTFVPAEESELFFRQADSLEVGIFLFSSKAEHAFARPMTGEYLLRTSRDGMPLAGDPIQLAAPHIILTPKSQKSIPVLLHCDGQTVRNPEPENHEYEFRFVGPASAGSSPGPHAFKLHRDPTRAEIELRVRYLDEVREIYWSPAGVAHSRPLGATGSATGPGQPLGEELRFEKPFPLSFREANPPLELLSFEVGNSARSGRGVVELAVSPHLALTDAAARLLHLNPNRRMEDVLQLYRFSARLETDTRPQLRVKEGESPQALGLRIEPAHIESIDGAYITADQCRAEVSLDILVRDDHGKETRRKLRLSAPVELERLPGPNWLCIDFGTSAIAAAMGSSIDDNFMTIRLQDVAVKKDGSRSYRQEEKNSLEEEPSFLPSWVICNADQREAKREQGEDGWRPGFPNFQPASLQPGQSSFVGLPALTHQVKSSPGRVIVSLKSWLGKGAREIRLQESVRYMGSRGEVRDSVLPLDEVVESGFAALAEAYLHDYRADQIVVCHPNTFTVRHRERLHVIATKALMKPFKIASIGHIRLISESDAVAYYYCSQRMRREPKSGWERLMVYDFGAGTLDISIILIEWNQEPCYPLTWTVEERAGVPVAGNYLDEILARIVDEQLRDPAVMNSTRLSYQIPVVRVEKPANLQVARSAIYDLYLAIKKTKHSWDGRSPFVVEVGSIEHGLGIVSANRTQGDDYPAADPNSASVGVRADGVIELSIPALMVYEHSMLQDFAQFVTGIVVDEALAAGSLQPQDIDTLIISGRGALWPGLKGALSGRFPNATEPEWLWSEVGVKEAVVRGAIARQSLLIEHTESTSVTHGKRLGVLLIKSGTLVTEEKWDRPIDLTLDATFRLVQVGLQNPDPRLDGKTLRRHFYVDLSGQIYQRETLWRNDPRLFVEKIMQGGRTVVLLKNSLGQVIPDEAETGIPGAMSPPWPIGSLFLHPLD